MKIRNITQLPNVTTSAVESTLAGILEEFSAITFEKTQNDQTTVYRYQDVVVKVTITITHVAENCHALTVEVVEDNMDSADLANIMERFNFANYIGPLSPTPVDCTRVAITYPHFTTTFSLEP